MKKILLAVLLLALAGGGGYYYYSNSAKKEAKPADPTAKVERTTIVDAVSSDGKVVSNLDVEIKCKASGTILTLPFDVSDEVRKGDLLVALDPTDEERSVRQALASLESSMARIETARINLAILEANLATDQKRASTELSTAQRRLEDSRAKAERTRELFERKLVSREEAETAETAEVVANSQVTAAEIKIKELEASAKTLDIRRQEIRVAQSQSQMDEIALEVARQRLADTRVKAPIDGIVTSRKVQVGQIISSPISNVGGGTTILTLSDLSRVFMIASVDESDIAKVALGQKASIRADSFPARTFDGEVVQISPLGVNNSNVVTFQVKIEVTSPEKKRLMPEMTANVQIVAATSENTLGVPTDAVYRKGGLAKVSVVNADGTNTETDVKTGISNGQMVEITSGVAEGTTVVVKKADAESRWRGGGPMMPFGVRRR